MLQVKNLTIRFPGAATAAVDDLSFSLPTGGRLGLLGLSGSGKSLTALALLGLLPPAAEIVGGQAIYQPAGGPAVDLLQLREKDWRRYRGTHLSLVFQEPLTALNPVQRIEPQLLEAIVRFCPALTTAAARRAHLRTWLSRVELTSDQERILHAYPHELSGGQRQRLLIALALLGEPRLLIADEPTTALDTVTEAGILQLLERLREDLGMASLFITHDLGVMRQSAEEILVMANGRELRRGPATALLAAGEALFDPEENSLTAQKRDGHVPASSGISEQDLLTVRNLSVAYPGPKAWPWSPNQSVAAVSDASFSLRAGEWLAVIGPSGCGKTSLARCLAGLLPRSAGIINYGQPGGIQMVFQDPFSSLNPAHTVLRSIVEVLRVVLPSAGKITLTEEAGRLLEEVGLPPEVYGSRKPAELSGGQRQRVAIARALAGRPAVLIADEAVSALDAPLRRDVLDLLDQIRQSQRLGLLFISHDLGLVADRADRVLIMDAGRIVEAGPPAEVLSVPKSEMGKRLQQARLAGS